MHTTVYSQQSLSQSDATIMIDDFVAKVLNSTSLAYKTSSHPEVRGDRGLQRYMPYLRAMLDVFNGRIDYDFSDPLKLFNGARLEIRLESVGSRFACPAPDDSHRFLSEPESFNLLIGRIRKNGHDGRYFRSLRDRAYDFKIRSHVLKTYVETVMEVYPCTLVVRGNLCYMQALKSWFRVGDVFADRCRLLNVLASHPVFAGLAGYTLEIEQVDLHGFYIHATFFFDAAKVKNEADHTERIGALWAGITDGRGYWGDIGQGLSGWRGREGRTTGVFEAANQTHVLRVAKGMTGLGRAGKALRIMPEDGQALIAGRWPNNQTA